MTGSNFEIREGKGVRWRIDTHHSILEGFTIDNLDTKNIDEAKCNFERLFVTIREVLKKNDGYCMDEENERLQVCQELAKTINQNNKKIFR